jgi:hypothetical protein
VGWIKQGSAKPLKEFDDFFKSLPPEPSSFRSTNIPNVRSGRAAHGTINIPIHISGGSVIVPVVFNSSVKTHLVLDTGASSTLISRNVATSLALHHIGAVRGVTVGGVINLAVARVKSLKIGSAEVFDLTVTIHDFSQHFPYDGLLGMDFLSQFDVSLHHHKRVLTLTPR